MRWMRSRRRLDVGSRADTVRGLAKRPLAAWFFEHGHEPGSAELLHVSVNDATLQRYCAALEGFLEWAGSWSTRTLDSQLAEYFSHVCFSLGCKPHVAATCLSAVLHFLPDVKGSLYRATRSLAAFRALVRPRDRPPFSRRSVGALIACMLLARCRVEACVAMVVFDICGRGAEWEMLRLSDVSIGSGPREGQVTLALGQSDRGERAKTGFDQGATVRTPAVAAWLAAHVRARRQACEAPSARLFKTSPQRFRTVFKAACVQLGLPLDTPHVLRHTAASELWASGAVTLAELKLAGRWARDSSVKRYCKPHLLASHEAAVAPPVLELGARFWADPLGYLART
jgi:hypothetical protein